MPAWLKGAISREECEDLIKPYENGKFCIRQRPDDDGEYVLCVVYKGKPTHHLITTNGGVKVNKKSYGGATTLEELVDVLSKPGVAGWPVQLIVPGGAEAGTPRGSSSGNRPWLHPRMSTEDATGLLKEHNDEPGFFLIRQHTSPTEFVISVIYKGKATHHLCVANPDEESTINKKSTGVKGIEATINKIKNRQPFWPVPLTNFVPGPDSSDKHQNVSPVRPVASKPKLSAPTGSSGGTNRQSTTKKGPPRWLHPEMGKPEAEELLKQGGAVPDGKFLVRKLPESQFVLSVCYKNKPTHHKVALNDAGVMCVGGKQYSTAKNIKTLVKHLSSNPAPPKWPCPLVMGVAKTGETFHFLAGAEVDGGGSADTDTASDNKAEEEAARKAEEEKAKNKEEEEEAARKAEEEEEARKQEEEEAEKAKEEAEDKKVTGFPSLQNPFPSSTEPAEDHSGAEDSNGYMTIGPTAQNLLTQARMIAMATASGLTAELKDKYNVGKLIQLTSDPNGVGSTSTDEYDVSGAPLYSNPYMTNSGIAGTSVGVKKMQELEEVVVDIDARVRSGNERLESLEQFLDCLPQTMTLRQEVLDLRAKNVELEKKLIMLEHLIMRTGPAENEAPVVSMIDVRQIVKEKQGHSVGRSAGAEKSTAALIAQDLTHTKLLGKIAVPRGTVYSEMRGMISEQFDEAHVPKEFSFYMVSEEMMETPDSELLRVHTKQESKVPLEEDLSTIYVHSTAVAKQVNRWG